jgi:hypothetical protein
VILTGVPASERGIKESITKKEEFMESKAKLLGHPIHPMLIKPPSAKLHAR